MAYLRRALAQTRRDDFLAALEASLPRSAQGPACTRCCVAGRPLFAGVCTPCEDLERRQDAHDEGRAVHGLGRSRAQVWRQMNPNE